MEILNKTGVPVKYSGDGLSHKDVNAINSTVNSCVDGANYLLKNFCNINMECNDFNRVFSLSQAIEFVPENRRSPGMKIRFLDEEGLYSEYTFTSPATSSDSWGNLKNWSRSLGVIDGGEW